MCKTLIKVNSEFIEFSYLKIDIMEVSKETYDLVFKKVEGQSEIMIKKGNKMTKVKNVLFSYNSYFPVYKIEFEV